MERMQKMEGNNNGQQLDINFRAAISSKYKVPDNEFLVERGGQFYYKDIPVEKYDEEMQKLESPIDNDIYHQN